MLPLHFATALFYDQGERVGLRFTIRPTPSDVSNAAPFKYTLVIARTLCYTDDAMLLKYVLSLFTITNHIRNANIRTVIESFYTFTLN